MSDHDCSAARRKADINSVKTQIGLFNTALERYAIDMNKFPSTEQGLMALVEEPSSRRRRNRRRTSDDLSADADAEDGGESESNWDGPYLKTSKLPKDPWGKAYRYEYPPKNGKGDQPDIWSLGPDGQENTEDDIVSWTGGKSGSEGGGDVLNDPIE